MAGYKRAGELTAIFESSKIRLKALFIWWLSLLSLKAFTNSAVTRSSEQREALQTLQTASEAMRYTFLSKDIAINATSQHSQHIFE